MTALIPLYDRLIVEPIDPPEKTTGGIYLPEKAQEKPMRGKVLATGPGAMNDKGEYLPMPVTEGQIVHYVRYGGIEVKAGGVDYLILKTTDLLAVEQ